MLGVDLGARRIGLAVSDPLWITAGPHGVLERGGDVDGDHRAIVGAAREVGASRIVVGLPRSLSGELGPAALAVLEEVEALVRHAGPDLLVDTWDERFTTVIAERSLAEAGVRGRRRRSRVDGVAAAVMLQSYLAYVAGLPRRPE
ncbi:MAG: Holliday junction resolvase RuvX [Acidimicrobiia bacterium]